MKQLLLSIINDFASEYAKHFGNENMNEIIGVISNEFKNKNIKELTEKEIMNVVHNIFDDNIDNDKYKTIYISALEYISTVLPKYLESIVSAKEKIIYSLCKKFVGEDEWNKMMDLNGRPIDEFLFNYVYAWIMEKPVDILSRFAEEIGKLVITKIYK